MSFPRYSEYKSSGPEWLQTIPAPWAVKSLRSLARVGRDTFVDGDWIESPYITDEGVRLIQTGNIAVGGYREQGYRYISDQTFVELKCTSVDPGDVLICRLAEPVGRACLAPDLGVKAITSVDVAILKLAEEFNSSFVVYLLSSPEYLGYLEGQCRGGTRDRVSRSFLGAVRLPIPSPAEQKSIAAFLDRETAKIDTLVAEQENLIALLKEKRQALISRAVIKGLDPAAPMKDSGIEWLGQVPVHWSVFRIGALFHEVADIGNGDLPILSVSIHDGVSDKELDETELDRKVSRSEDRSKYKVVRPGDLAYNMMRAWQGGFGAVTVNGQVSPAYIVARPLREMRTAFVEQILRTPHAVEQMRRYSRGVTDFRLRLYWEEFKNLRIALPSVEEQQAILDEISAETRKFDALTAEANRAIELLKERRSALISAAVTGKIDVRGVVNRSRQELMS